jgi:exosome complex component RRP41
MANRPKYYRQASTELSNALRDAFQPHLHTQIYPHSTISIHVSVLSADGSLFAACINACTLALVDAGIPMPGLLCGCTVGMSGPASTPASAAESSKVGGGVNESLDPLLDLSLPEEQELPFMTIATGTSSPSGPDDMEEDEDEDDDDDENRMISVVQMESRVHVSYLETMFAVGIDGCKQIRQVLDGVIKAAGRKILEGEAEEDMLEE